MPAPFMRISFFTHQFCRQATFLDAALSITGDSISTDLHTKQTDTHQYLLPSSDRPPHVHRGLPYGLDIRINIVSDEETLKRRLEELATFLTARHHPQGLIDRQLDRVRAKQRQDLLDRQQCVPTRPLVCTWNSSLPHFNTIIQQALPTLQATERLTMAFDKPFSSLQTTA